MEFATAERDAPYESLNTQQLLSVFENRGYSRMIHCIEENRLEEADKVAELMQKVGLI